jgi:hypothetical protein
LLVELDWEYWLTKGIEAKDGMSEVGHIEMRKK